MTDFQFDVSGKPGEDGRHGANGAHGRPSMAGHDGGDATEPTRGEDAGQLALRLQADADGTIAIEARASRWPPQAHRIGAARLGTIEVRAVGGRGGHGGNGGHGGHGGDGRDGADATRHRSGSDGGNGGRGGNGGAGTSGADGGHGNQITVDVAERDTYLLMAVDHSADPAPIVRGGNGGRRGRHGKGGRGGRGGRGGSSYSWSDTDSQGRRSYHTNSGGTSGRDGFDGHTPTLSLHDGEDGEDGQFAIHVHTAAGGTTTYTHRYDLVIEGFEHVEAPTSEHDGIFEFGEEVHVRGLVLRNVGGMPTPPFQRIRLTLYDGELVRPHDDDLFIERSLAPGESIALPGSLRFRIARREATEPGDPLVVEEAIRPCVTQLGPEVPGLPAAQTPFQRVYPWANLTRTLQARFPVENATDVVAVRSLAHGERTRCRFEIRNISATAIGEQSPRRRAVALQIEWVGGDVPADALVFRDSRGEPYPLASSREGFAGYVVRIPFIDAHSAVTIETHAGFTRRVEAYMGATLRYTIWIADIDAPQRWCRVQCRDLPLRLEPSFAARPGVRALLVVNNNTSLEAFRAWQQLLENELGLGVDFWSISRYGHFAHRQPLDDGTNLRVQLEDRLAIVLNQPFQPRSTSEADLPTDYVRGRDFRESATGNNTHYLIVGQRDFTMQQWLEPTARERLRGSDFPTVASYLKKESASAGTHVEEIFREDITLCFDQVRARAWTFPFFKPAPERIVRVARRLQKRLTKLFPNRRYVLIHHASKEPERAGRIWCGFPRWDLGYVEVRRTLNTETSEAVVIECSAERMNQAAFIATDDVRFAVLSALSFEEKLESLNRAMQRPGCDDATMKMVVAALLVDLTEEQAAVRRSRAPLTPDFFEQRFANFGRLLTYPLHTLIPADARRWTYIYELCAGLEALTRAYGGGVLFGRRNRAITRHIEARLKIWYGQLFDGHAIDPDGNVAIDSHTARTSHIAPRVAALLASFNTTLRAMPWEQRQHTRRHDIARQHFLHPPGLTHRVTRDSECWLDPTDRIWSPRDLKRARRGEARREAKQDELRQLNAAARSELVVSDAAVEAGREVGVQVMQAVVVGK